MTKTSSFLLFLVKTCFISIVKTEKKNRFSLLKLSVYTALSFGFLLANSIMYMDVKDEWMNDHQLSLQVEIYI